MKKKLYLVLGMLIALGAVLVLFTPKSVSAKSSKVKAEYYQLIKEGTADIRLTYYHRKGSDKVLKQTSETTMTYTAMKVSDAAAAKEKIGPQTEKYQGIKGVTEHVEYKDTYAVEKISVDYEHSNLNDLAKKLPEINLDTPSGKKATYISLKQSEKLLKKQGYSKVKKGQFKKLKLD